MIHNSYHNMANDNSNAKKNNKIVASVISGVVLCTIFLLIGIITVVQFSGGEQAGKGLKLAYKYLENGWYEEAIIEFNKVLEIDSKNTKAILGIADAYVGMENNDAATAFLEEQIAENPTNEMLYDKLISIYVSVGDHENALRIINLAKSNGCNYEYDGDVIEDCVAKRNIKCGDYFLEYETHAMWIDSKGLWVRDNLAWTEELVAEGEYDSKFATDGSVVYVHDARRLKLVQININTGEVTDLADTCKSFDSTRAIYSADVLAYCDGYLHVREWNDDWDKADYVFDTVGKEYKAVEKSSWWYDIDVYGGKVYYGESTNGGYGGTLYVADANGENEAVFQEDVLSFKFVEDNLYYAECPWSEDGEDEGYIKRMNMTDGTIEIIGEAIGGYGWYHFNNVGFSTERLRYDEDLTDIKLYDGTIATIKGCPSFATKENYFISSTYSDEKRWFYLWDKGKVATFDLEFNAVKYETDTGSYIKHGDVVGYSNKLVYYTEYKKSGGKETYSIKSKMLEFN